jgi:hypothetical protein
MADPRQRGVSGEPAGRQDELNRPKEGKVSAVIAAATKSQNRRVS